MLEIEFIPKPKPKPKQASEPQSNRFNAKAVVGNLIVFYKHIQSQIVSIFTGILCLFLIIPTFTQSVFASLKALSMSSIFSWCHRYALELIIGLVGTFILLIPSLTQALQFDRNLVHSHHYWLLITGQLTHFNFTHWILDYLAIIIAAIYSPLGLNKHGFIQVSLSLIVVGVGIWLFGESTYYRGISGVVYGWLFLAVLRSPKVDMGEFSVPLIFVIMIVRFKENMFNLFYKALFISLIFIKVFSDVMGWDLFGIPDQIGASVSVAAHVSGLIAVIVILPLQWRLIKFNFIKESGNPV